MYNDKIRKITSLMLMTVMVAGGMTVAFSGFEPNAYAANEHFKVSAQEVGNFAGIQVLELVVSDPAFTATDETQGIPDVEINNQDVRMVQGSDGYWYAYIANEIAIQTYNSTVGYDISDIYKQSGIEKDLSGSDARGTYIDMDTFLKGSKTISPHAPNNPGFTHGNWPFVQSFDISSNTDVTFTYSNSEVVEIEYDYDDTKDITLDRDTYPEGAYVHISTDDSLLNLSPTADDTWVFLTNSTTKYVFEDDTHTSVDYTKIGFEEGPITTSIGGVLAFTNSTVNDVFGEEGGNGFDTAVIMIESNTDKNLFVNYDNQDQTGFKVKPVNGEASISYNDAHSVVYATTTGTLVFDGPTIEEWLSGVVIDLQLTDKDRNLNSRSEETLDILKGEVPYIKIGNPINIDNNIVKITNATHPDIAISPVTNSVTDSKTVKLDIAEANYIVVNATWPDNYKTSINNGYLFPYVNYDFKDFGGPSGTFYTGNTTGKDIDTGSAITTPAKVEVQSDGTVASFKFDITDITTATGPNNGVVYFDLFFFGQLGALTTTGGDIKDNIERVNDAFYRFELEETDKNTSKFVGELEYMMINQLNVFDKNTYGSIDAADDTIVIIVNDDMDGADSVTVSYGDINSSKNPKTISVQEAANTHTGSIELDSTGYSAGNTIEVTLIDVDLNTDSDTIQTYTVDSGKEWVGDGSTWLSQFKIKDKLFDDSCTKGLGLSDTQFTLTETGDQTGIFRGTLQLPANYCDGSDDPEISGTDTRGTATTNGLDLEFEYQDYADQSGEPNETSVSASVRSNTGSVSLDSTVYPVPFGDTKHKFFTYDSTTTTLGEGPVLITIQVNDPDFNINSAGEDTMSSSFVSLKVSRGSNSETIVIPSSELLVETDPESGIFELDLAITDTDYNGLDGSTEASSEDVIHQGDILTVTYTDPNDAGGDPNSVTDSATFDLRNAVLQTDKIEYIIGSEAIITLIEPDLNLDTDNAETWSLNLINWDSDAGDHNLSDYQFDANPAGLRETGDNTGIFQVVIEIPKDLDGDALERAENITLEYQDNGPAGADYIGDDDEDIRTEIKTSSFGSSISLDQKVYTWTDKVYLTVVSPDHNFDSNTIDEIGDTNDNEIKITTREDKLELYKLVETGPDTGIFVGEVILTGIDHDADGDGDAKDTPNTTAPKNNGGPTNGLLQASDDDGLTISFESSDGEVVIGSAIIRWNIGEVQWMESSYPASGSGVIRVIDPDMNWNPESVDSFDITVWSDSSTGGVSLSVTETNEQTGIFEGTVYFTTTQGSSGSRLNVSEGDTITAKYEDNTLPDPYSRADELSITAVANIGSIVPPLERAPAGNLHAVDALGNSLNTVSIDQQVQIEADIHNGQDRDQTFAYLVQVQDGNGVTVSLAWITGDLTPGQNFTPALSWIPTELGEYTATAFVWESVNNPTALSPPVTTTITVN
jgi:hypothetical protein